MGVKVRKVLSDGRVEVEISLGDQRKSKQSCWAKKLESVDTSRENGYAFIGDFLSRYSIVEEGSYIVAVESVGSWRHPASKIVLYRVQNNEVVTVYVAQWNTRGDKIAAINDIAKILERGEEQ